MTSEDRLAKLENELARTRSSVKALGIAIVILVVMSVVWGIVADAGGERPDGGGLALPLNEVRAKKFVLVDEKGTTRAVLGVIKDGSSLKVYDENGKGRAMLCVAKEGPSLALYDEKSMSRAGLAVAKDGSLLVLCDERGKGGVTLGIARDGSSVTVHDENGKDRATLGTSKIETLDGKTTTYPESSLLLFGPDGKVLWQAP